MIRLIYGKKGSGKSKKLLDMANEEVDKASGNIVYIDDNNRCIYDLKHEIRFINTADYGIDNADKLYGFVCGILSGNFDISSMYIDGLKSFIKTEDRNLESLISRFESLFSDIDAYMVLSGGEKAPEFLEKYII
jgi:ATP-dependent helicase/DNAse subunit B